ncbi:MAG: hypothetical protein EHM34_04770 [Nitrosopumilales archaeon]|nr:MAG: hypothetical protein EHM34_04770 [Nitrosopumilales archaeon]
MAVESKTHHWIYQLVLSEGQLDYYESLIRDNKAEYVAGELIGRLKSNGKLVVPKDSLVTEEK